MRSFPFSAFFFFLLGPILAVGQTKLPIQQAIEAQYPLTKATADHKDMVTPGAVIDLLKDNLIMFTADSAAPANVTYQDGKFKTSGFSKVMGWHNPLGSTPSTTSRTFVAGEKFWLIGVNIRDDGAVLEFLSDPFNDVRYRTFVKYPFPKGTVPPPDVVMAAIAQTIKAEPMDEKQAGAGAAAPAPGAPAAPAGPAPAKMADIAPPPPPADAPPPAPKTISLGQTKDQVSAIFGQPNKIVNLGTKEIDYYPDMKVTFVKGKVTDVQ
jgi:hypothetical protein